VIHGRLDIVAETLVVVPFSGVVMQDAVWTPQLSVSNDTDEDLAGTAHYNAFGVECASATTATDNAE
jgi:hypothetical protein